MSTVARPASGSPQLRGFQRLWRTVKQIFYEVAGAMFALLAFGWLNLAFRSWTQDVAHWWIGLSVGMGLLFVWFAVSSFRRAQRL